MPKVVRPEALDTMLIQLKSDIDNVSVLYSHVGCIKKIKPSIKINCDLHQQKNREQNANVRRVIHRIIKCLMSTPNHTSFHTRGLTHYQQLALLFGKTRSCLESHQGPSILFNSYMKSQVLLREKIVMHNCYKTNKINSLVIIISLESLTSLPQ